jgi:predicted GNAT family N-acyltransferase
MPEPGPATAPAFRVREADWERDRDALRRVRETVFVREQGVPVELEWDGLDPDCLHLLAETQDGQAIGTGRLLPDGHLGRMAVLAPWRDRGVGKALLEGLIAAARRRGLARLALNAQTYAISFYAKMGFVVSGDEFIDAGIPHRRMVMPLDPADDPTT